MICCLDPQFRIGVAPSFAFMLALFLIGLATGVSLKAPLQRFEHEGGDMKVVQGSTGLKEGREAFPFEKVPSSYSQLKCETLSQDSTDDLYAGYRAIRSRLAENEMMNGVNFNWLDCRSGCKIGDDQWQATQNAKIQRVRDTALQPIPADAKPSSMVGNPPVLSVLWRTLEHRILRGYACLALEEGKESFQAKSSGIQETWQNLNSYASSTHQQVLQAQMLCYQENGQTVTAWATPLQGVAKAKELGVDLFDLLVFNCVPELQSKKQFILQAVQQELSQGPSFPVEVPTKAGPVTSQSSAIWQAMQGMTQRYQAEADINRLGIGPWTIQTQHLALALQKHDAYLVCKTRSFLEATSNPQADWQSLRMDEFCQPKLKAQMKVHVVYQGRTEHYEFNETYSGSDLRQAVSEATHIPATEIRYDRNVTDGALATQRLQDQTIYVLTGVNITSRDMSSMVYVKGSEPLTHMRDEVKKQGKMRTPPEKWKFFKGDAELDLNKTPDSMGLVHGDQVDLTETVALKVQGPDGKPFSVEMDSRQTADDYRRKVQEKLNLSEPPLADQFAPDVPDGMVVNDIPPEVMKTPIIVRVPPSQENRVLILRDDPINSLTSQVQLPDSPNLVWTLERTGAVLKPDSKFSQSDVKSGDVIEIKAPTQVVVVSPDGEEFPVELPPTPKGIDLKKKVQEKTKIPPPKQLFGRDIPDGPLVDFDFDMPIRMKKVVVVVSEVKKGAKTDVAVFPNDTIATLKENTPMEQLEVTAEM
ncbi:MAG: uncharacterized protein KVP18_002229, partial [Porospora cf. gigantea A]